MSAISREKERTEILRLLNESSDEEVIDSGGTSDEEEDGCSMSEHDTDSEQQCSDVELSEKRSDHVYVGKDGVTKWNMQAPRPNVRTSRSNIVTQRSGLIGNKNGFRTPTDCFRAMFDERMIEHIVSCTNIQIQKVAKNYSRERDASKTDMEEIECLIGILLFAGANKSGRQNLLDLWDRSGLGVELCYSSMSHHRFLFLLRCLRFDDLNTRMERIKADKLAPIRDIFQIFVGNIQQHYRIGVFATFDEQLVPFRGRCSFRQYLPSKPAKYGIKIFALVDSSVFYTLNLEIYAGRQPEGPFFVDNCPKEVVKRMVSPIIGSGRNITVDNWFASTPLAEEMIRNNLTLVGTVRKNKRELPPDIVNVREREEKSSLFCFRKNIALVSYVPKKSKNVILLSTMHSRISIDESTGNKRKPEILTFYNST
ncbi:piggyBac transposable element-derived protein 3-like [Ischnura elegans]|uniref:piggyBac transposable element-derived protein 3-like n=1 Tax=Ischnura elegans TaxID=197161 RepID=UPI001ED8AFE4|nr:piggyBac transposable element-derived protein 3-like [Ischnura elegans]